MVEDMLMALAGVSVIEPVAQRAPRQPNGDEASESQTRGNEGLAKVALGSRPGSRRRFLAVGIGGKSAELFRRQ